MMRALSMLVLLAPALPGAAFGSPLQSDEIARRYGVDPALLRTVCEIESNWQPEAVGDDGMSIGLCQLQAETALELYPKDWKRHLTRAQRMAEMRRLLFDPQTNMTLAAIYLKRLLERYNGDVTLAVMAYNAGENFVTPRYECKDRHIKTALCYAGKVRRKMLRRTDSPPPKEEP